MQHIPIHSRCLYCSSFVRHNDKRCDSTTAVLNILANPLPVITGYATAIVGTTYTYTTVSGMTNYQWTISSGGTIISGGGPNDNTIQVQWNIAGTPNGNGELYQPERMFHADSRAKNHHGHYQFCGHRFYSTGYSLCGWNRQHHQSFPGSHNLLLELLFRKRKQQPHRCEYRKPGGLLSIPPI